MLTERLLDPATARAASALLAASPVDPGLERFCDPVPADPIADQSTWADDVRTAEPATGRWHFIDLPLALETRTAGTTAYRPFCARGACIVEAIPAQFRRLRSSRQVAERAAALRFLIHLVADVHQPLHAATNGDRGGNCLPVRYYRQAPKEGERGSFTPNLHTVWDGGSIRTLMARERLGDARALADFIARLRPLPAAVSAQEPTPARVLDWAEEASGVAKDVAYGRLPQPVPIEPVDAVGLGSCQDNRDVGRRMRALNERIGAAYERTAIPVLLGQLRLAAIRLAETLKAAFG